MRYYSITVCSNANGLHAGERFCKAQTPLSIGQQASADIQLPCIGDLLPQCFCLILPSAAGDGWNLVRKSDFYAVKVNGEEIDHIYRLNDGDTITTEGCTFVFHTHNDDNYVEGQGLLRSAPSHHWGRTLLWCISLLAVLAISIGYPMLSKNMNSFTSSNISEVRSSVYKIVVSEFMLQRHTPDDSLDVFRTIDSYEPDSVSIGTCFFTCDSLCVTARHCVEPWIDYSDWTDNTTMNDLPQDVYWAILSEQSQMEQSDTLYRIISRCQVMDDDSCICEFTSDKCLFNRSRDIIARMGDERLPWRIVYPLYSRQDVELGDFAFVRTERKGELELATDTYLASVTNDEETEIRIFGYPRTNHGNLWESQTVSEIKIPEKLENGYDRCIQLTVGGTSGYSGAPVIVKKNGKMMVVGIFSKIDDFVDSKNKFYAVPANEVSQYNPKANNEAKQYRR